MNIFLISNEEFYKKLLLIKFSLKNKHKIILPNFELGKTSKFIDKKQAIFKKDIELLEKSDSILIANFKKGKIDNYISSKELMMMTIAFYLKKKIFILYDLPKLNYKKEIKSLEPICLEGNLKELRI